MAWIKSVEGGAVLWPRDRKREEDQRAALLLLLAVAAADVKQTRTTRANKCRGPARQDAPAHAHVLSGCCG
jgi:hypothetical protein